MAHKVPISEQAMVRHLNRIFQYFQKRTRVEVCLNENMEMTILGHIVGFDEHLNLVLDEAEERYLESDQRKKLGRIMLKGDNITLIQCANPESDS